MYYLTEAERCVFSEMLTGASNQEISEQLIISPHTVKAHVAHIIQKLEAKNRTNAVARGLLQVLDIDKESYKYIKEKAVKNAFKKGNSPEN